MSISADNDADRVAELLGRRPQGGFAVVARGLDGDPVVIRNDPLLDDGTPMPTRYWLVGEPERRFVGRLESEGGVRRAEAAVGPEAIRAIHDAASRERDEAFDALVAERSGGADDSANRRPSGGVGGTATGVKCLHAHLANLYAGHDDPVGEWVVEQIRTTEGADALRDVVQVGDTGRTVIDTSRPSTASSAAVPTVAVVDIGTNTTRLFVARGAEVLERRAVITRTGEGLHATGRLSATGIDRVLTALADYADVVAALGVDHVRVLATEAARRATNASDLLVPIADLFGVEPEILTGEEEGRLTFAGACAAAPAHDGWTLVVDIGGGSTEFAVGRDTCDGVVSIPVGSVTLTEAYIEHDPPRPEELSAVLSVLGAHLDDVLQELPLVARADRLIAVAGTATTVAAVEIGLLTWDRDRVHGFVLSHDAAEDVFRTLATEALDDRIHNPGLDPQRADVIVAGSAILVGIMRTFGHDECIVLDADLLDGAAAGMSDS